MSQRVTRRGEAARKVARRQGTQQRVKRARAKTGSTYGRAIAWLPFTEQQVQRVFVALILGGMAALAWFVAGLAGIPAMAEARFAALASDAGYKVARVEVQGVERMNELLVYEKVLSARRRAMPQVDLAEIRESVKSLDWVKDARVSRQLPDTLVIDIVERTPHAVLQKPDRLVLIDAEGHELAAISAEDAEAYLRVEGPGAQRQVAQLTQLLDAAPAMRSQVANAEWIGNRRWTLEFKTGQLLALPQGDSEARDALMRFARLDGSTRLLGGNVASFDMRISERIYLRRAGSEEPVALEMEGAGDE